MGLFQNGGLKELHGLCSCIEKQILTKKYIKMIQTVDRTKKNSLKIFHVISNVWDTW